MKEIKSVVIVNDFAYTQGGASRIAIDTAEMLAEAGLKVFFFCGDSANNSELRNKDVTIVSTGQNENLKNKNKFVGAKNGIYNNLAKKRLKQLLSTLSPSETVVHVHGWTKILSSSIFDAAFELNFSVVLTLHDYFFACPNGGFYIYPDNKPCCLRAMGMKCRVKNCDSRCYAMKLYRLLRQDVQNKIVKLPQKIKYVITVSAYSEEILKEYFRKDVYVERIENYVDMPSRNERVTAERNKPFLFVGRLEVGKGIELFCDAVSSAGLPGVVIGDGSLAKDLKEKYKDIDFLGWKEKDDIYKNMEKARCLIFPSLWHETMGLTAVEALKAGVPVIASEGTAAAGLVANNKNGYIFKRANREDLIMKMKMCSDENVERMSTEAFLAYRNKYDKRGYRKKIERLYKKIIREIR
ncbi:MAG: glycosyltransferase [Candidatus Saccharibacteria bacterium]|nr:glycosyltransferase [Candidatus Saccharibacteria bacterium]